LPPTVTFIGSHPMAGSEKKGSAFADADLFVNRATILTTDGPPPTEALEKLAQFWTALGSRVHRMSAAEHDHTVAYVSHLPHVVAAALAAVVDPGLLPLSAGGFRDTTRIAAAAPAIWEPIFRTNRAEVLAACEAFIQQFQAFQTLLADDNGEGLIRWLTEGKRVRDALGS
jgi:prephenate dehydrogenase